MSLIPPNHPTNHTPSIFDLLETFHSEFHRLRQQSRTINSALNSYIQNAQTQDPHQFYNITSSLGLSSEELSQMAHIDGKFHRINDIIENLSQVHFQEQMTLSAKYEQELEESRKEIDRLKRSNIDLQSQYEQEKIHWALDRKRLEDKVLGLDESKTALIKSITDTANEEKANKKNMEMWFKRRLDALEHHIIELKENPQDQKKFEQILNKIRGLKKKQPWNMDKKRPNLVIDDEVLNQRSEVFSNGTATPFSHYVGVLSSAATENNFLDKAFVCSDENSFPATQKSQISFLSGRSSTERKNTKQKLLDNVVRKLHDSQVSLGEKERLFCELFKGTPGNGDLIHVNKDDILNAVNASSKSLDLISLDLKPSGKVKGTFKFNQTLRLVDPKDTKIEKVISPIQSQGSHKSSGILGTLKRSKSFNRSKRILTGLEELMEMNMTGGGKQEGMSVLDQGIMQEMSIIPGSGLCKELGKFSGSLEGVLSSKVGKRILMEEEKTLKTDKIERNPTQSIDLSGIEKDKKTTKNKFRELLIDESSALEEETSNILTKMSGELKFSNSFKRSFKEMSFTEQEIKVGKGPETENFHNMLNKFLHNIDLGPQKAIKGGNSNMVVNECIEVDQEEVKTTPKAKKAKVVPLLNPPVIEENNQTVPKTHVDLAAIDDTMNPIEAQEQKAHKANREEVKVQEDNSKRPGSTPNKEERIVNKNAKKPSRTPIKMNKRHVEEVRPVIPGLKIRYNPRSSVDSSFTGQPKVASDSQHRVYLGPSPIVKGNEKKGRHKPQYSHQLPSMSNIDMSLDAKYHQEQEDRQERRVNRGASFSQKSDYKNLSFSIEQEQKFTQPPKAQIHRMNSILGRNTHTRQKTADAYPPQKVQSQSHFIRLFAQNQSQLSPSAAANASSSILNSSNSQFGSLPSSQNSTQEAKLGQIVGSSGLNLLKKVLLPESSKRYPTPVKFEDKASMRRIANENVDPVSMIKETSMSKEVNKAIRPSGSAKKDPKLKPTSPIKSSANLESNVGQKKSKKGDEKEKVGEVHVASAALVNGSNQFRARMFAPKKV